MNEENNNNYNPYNYYSEQPRRRQTPENALDFNLAILDNVWGKDNINSDLYNKLTKNSYFLDQETGKISVDKEHLWGLLGFYTRDMRLGNLNPGDFISCEFFINLASDFLNKDMVEPFLCSLSRAITVLELSQSKGGFLRRQNNTLTSENVEKTLEPTKKSLFTGKQKN